jgi:hypothetical protein
MSTALGQVFRFFQLNKQMEKCMAAVNANLLKHNLMMAVDDRGKISCHKVNLCFIYIQPSECIVSGSLCTLSG